MNAPTIIIGLIILAVFAAIVGKGIYTPPPWQELLLLRELLRRRVRPLRLVRAVPP